jgi:hypothetical protein
MLKFQQEDYGISPYIGAITGRLLLQKTRDRCSAEFLIYILAFKKSETALCDRHSAKINECVQITILKSKNHYAESSYLKPSHCRL